MFFSWSTELLTCGVSALKDGDSPLSRLLLLAMDETRAEAGGGNQSLVDRSRCDDQDEDKYKDKDRDEDEDEGYGKLQKQAGEEELGAQVEQGRGGTDHNDRTEE
eukprot:754790-Hanusia_phi.AAC.1